MNKLDLVAVRILLKRSIGLIRVAILLLLLAFTSTTIQAQLSFTNGSPSALIDFSNTMPTTVGSNPSTAFGATGFGPNTATAGQLNSNAWAQTGWSDGALAFGGAFGTPTDYGRGATAIAVNTGGIYAYTGLPNSVANPAYMMQPGGSDFTPGTLTLKMVNNGSTIINQLAVSYNIYVRNDQARSQSLTFSYSTDNVTYTTVPAMDYATPVAADGLGWVVVAGSPSRSTTITGIAVPPTSFLYIRWSSDDVSGLGSRDEIGLDDINLTANYITACTGPTPNATLNSFSNVLGNQMTVNFTRGVGTGGMLAVVSPAALSSNPISGLIYAANSNYGTGAAIGNGYVVYNSNAGSGSFTITGLTPSTNYNVNLFEYDVSVPCYTAVGALGTQTTAALSAIGSSQFRTNGTTGNWANAFSWDYFNAGSWVAADRIPTSTDVSILVQAGHTIDISAPANIAVTTIAGTTTLSNGGIINLIDKAGADISISSGGILKVLSTTNFTTTFSIAPSATINIATGGKITIGNGASTPGYSPLASTTAQEIWNDGSIFEWNTTDPFLTSNITYFPDAAAGVIPIFRVSKSPSLQPGSANPTLWNGLLEVNADLTLKLAGTKTFRNGIIGTNALTQDDASGQFIINGATAKLGIATLNLNTTTINGLSINAASITTMTSNVVVNSAGTGVFLLTGSAALYCDNFIMSGTGIFTLTAASTMRLGDPGGISNNPSATGNIQVTGLRTYNMNTSFIYNGTANQVTGNGMPTTITALTIANTGAVGNKTVTLTTTNTSTQSLTLTSGLFASGTAQQLNILATGTVTATAGDFATGATAGIINFAGAGSFSGTCNPYDVYASGAVDFGLGTVTIQNGGSFRINTGGSVNTRPPVYAVGSTLIYNTGLNFNIGAEWKLVATAGAGYPHHVTILASGTILNFNGAVSYHAMGGDMNISSGTTLSLSTANGGDIKLKGNWMRAATGIFNHNGRTVFFYGTTNDQTITVTGGGTEAFGSINISKAAGFRNVILAGAPNATNISLDGNPLVATTTLALKIGNLDLNQNTCNFKSWNAFANNISVDGTAPSPNDSIKSTGGTGVFAINNSDASSRTVTISRVFASSLMNFGSTVKLTIGGASTTGGIDFGAGLISTVDGILEIETRGFVSNNAPSYGTNSTLVYNPGGTYNRAIEWGSTTSQPGYPYNVTVQNSTTFNLNNGPLITNNSNRYLAGTLTIGNGSSLILNSSALYNPNILTIGTNLVLNGTLTLPGGGSAFGEDVHIAGNWTRSSTGVFNPNTRAVYFEGATNSTITANGGETFDYLRLTKNTSAQSLLLSDNINITKEFSITTGIFNLQNKDATFKSDATYTASLTAINPANASINYSGTGRFIVERFIPTGTGGLNHGRTWQFLAVPTKGSTINQSWQEGYASLAFTPGFNYGTTISSELPTATSRGYDFYTYPGPSMKSYDYSIGASGGWVSVDDGATNTNAQLIDNPKGYMLFVRGDRSVQTSATTATPTTMRTRGKIYSPGAEAPATVNVVANKYESIGNPYPSAIDFTLLAPTGGVDNAFYVWDPTLSGTYGLGGYQFISSAAGWVPASAGTTNYPAATANSRIQSGQAFFVHATGSAGTVPFTEGCKANGSAVVFRPGNVNRSLMRAALYTGSGSTANIADGNVVAFDWNYHNGYDGIDGLKMMNTGENFGISRFAKILALEARRPVEYTDTIFYSLANLRKQAYEFRFTPENLTMAGVRAYLVDKLDNSHTAVSLNSETDITFTITDNPATAAADRFMLVFRKRDKHLISSDLKAAREENDIAINWTAEDESSSGTYEIERSADGKNFSSIHTEPANGTAGYTWKDTDPLPGINYYRIHNLDKENALSSYSNLAKVSAALITKPIIAADAITVYPNPVTNGLLGLQFNSAIKGTYSLKLYNSSGQMAFSKDIFIAGVTGSSIIKLPAVFAKGIYKLEITRPDGSNLVKQVFID